MSGAGLIRREQSHACNDSIHQIRTKDVVNKIGRRERRSGAPSYARKAGSATARCRINAAGSRIEGAGEIYGGTDGTAIVDGPGGTGSIESASAVGAGSANHTQADAGRGTSQSADEAKRITSCYIRREVGRILLDQESRATRGAARFKLNHI